MDTTDIDAISLAIKADIDGVRNGLEKSIAASRVETIKWFVTTKGLQTLVILGAALALARMASH